MTEETLLCEQPASHRAVLGLVNPNIQNMIHAGNIEGALSELGVSSDTSVNLVEAATLEREKELERLKKTLAFKETNDYSTPIAKEMALNNLKTKIASVEEQLKVFRERLSTTEECPICYEDPKSSAATLTPCCHRIFCGECILNSLTRRLACPMCRSPIQTNQLVRLVDEKKKTPKKVEVKLLSKSKQLIKFLKENPNQHPWKRKGKQKSLPCEKLKTILQENDLIFNEEYTPIESDRFYSMDISFLKNKIGVEVNGNQHYNSDGSLKEYYRIRNEHFISLGWKIIEIHYSKVYIDEFVIKLVDYLKTFDEYSYEELKELNNLIKFNKGNKDKHCSCGKKILKNSKTCNQCWALYRRKVDRPTYNVLINDVKELGYLGTGRKYGVSDNSIRKWIKAQRE
jgi:very-short-patch-repair endonuclease